MRSPQTSIGHILLVQYPEELKIDLWEYIGVILGFYMARDYIRSIVPQQRLKVRLL